MRLNHAMSNILHQTLEKNVNILYQPTYSLFDHILYELNFLFVTVQPNCHNQKIVTTTNNNIDLYNYDLLLSHNIFEAHKEQINIGLHINRIICHHSNSPWQLKKEDRIILQNQLSKTTIINFSNNRLSYNKEHQIQYGIPLDIFSNTDISQKNHKKILISHNDINIFNMLQKTLSSDFICMEMNLNDTVANINNALDSTNIYIDLTNNYVNTLCALAKGCKCLITQQPPDKHLKDIYVFNNLNNITSNISNIALSTIDINNIRKYLDETYNFMSFQSNMNQIITHTAKKEAFVL